MISLCGTRCNATETRLHNMSDEAAEVSKPSWVRMASTAKLRSATCIRRCKRMYQDRLSSGIDGWHSVRRTTSDWVHPRSPGFVRYIPQTRKCLLINATGASAQPTVFTHADAGIAEEF